MKMYTSWKRMKTTCKAKLKTALNNLYRLLYMDNVLKEPIKRNVFFLAVIFFMGLAVLIGTQEVLRGYNNRYETSLENQRARYSLGKIILKKLLLIELDIKGVISTNDPRDFDLLEKRKQPPFRIFIPR